MTDLIAEKPKVEKSNTPKTDNLHPIFKQKETSTKYSEQLLSDPEAGDKLVSDIKKAVFDEYDRALVEGTSSKEEVEINKSTSRQFIRLL